MNITDFIREGKKVILKHLSDIGEDNVEISEHEVVKANDLRLHAISLMRDGDICGPTIYPDQLYGRYQAGEDPDKLFGELAKMAEEALHSPMPDIPEFINFELGKIGARLSLRAIDLKYNLDFASDRPYIDTGTGLAMVAYINGDETINCPWKLAVTDSVMEITDCSAEELLTRAMENMQDMAPPYMTALDMISLRRMDINLLGDNPGEARRITAELRPGYISRPYLVTNEQFFLGASVLFYPGVMARIAEILGESYHVIPSSVHEVIIIQDSMGISPEHMMEMLFEGNTTAVPDVTDILSYRIFRYDAEKGELEAVKCSPRHLKSSIGMRGRSCS